VEKLRSDDPYLQRVCQTREQWFSVPDMHRVRDSHAIIEVYKAQRVDPPDTLPVVSLLERALLWSASYDESGLGELAKGLSCVPRLREAVARAASAYATTDPGGMPLRRAEAYIGALRDYGRALRDYGKVVDPSLAPLHVLRALVDESRQTWLASAGHGAESERLCSHLREAGVADRLVDNLGRVLCSDAVWNDGALRRLGKEVAEIGELFDEDRRCWPAVPFIVPGCSVIFSTRGACESYLRALKHYAEAGPASASPGEGAEQQEPKPQPGPVPRQLIEARTEWLLLKREDRGEEQTRVLLDLQKRGIADGVVLGAVDEALSERAIADAAFRRIARAVVLLASVLADWRMLWKAAKGEAGRASKRYLMALYGYGLAIVSAKEEEPSDGARPPAPPDASLDPMTRDLARAMYEWNNVLCSVQARVEAWMPGALVSWGWCKENAEYAVEMWKALPPWSVGTDLCLFLAGMPNIPPGLADERESDWNQAATTPGAIPGDHDGRYAAPVAWRRLVAMQAYGRRLAEEGFIRGSEAAPTVEAAPQPVCAASTRPSEEPAPTAGGSLEALLHLVCTRAERWRGLSSAERARARELIRHAIHVAAPDEERAVMAPLLIDVPLTDDGISTLAHNLAWCDLPALAIEGGTAAQEADIGLRLVTALWNYGMAKRREYEARKLTAAELLREYEYGCRVAWCSINATQRSHAASRICDAIRAAGGTDDDSVKCYSLLADELLPYEEQAEMLRRVDVIDRFEPPSDDPSSVERPVEQGVKLLRAFRKYALALYEEKQAAAEPATKSLSDLEHDYRRALSSWGYCTGYREVIARIEASLDRLGASADDVGYVQDALGTGGITLHDLARTAGRIPQLDDPSLDAEFPASSANLLGLQVLRAIRAYAKEEQRLADIGRHAGPPPSAGSSLAGPATAACAADVLARSRRECARALARWWGVPFEKRASEIGRLCSLLLEEDNNLKQADAVTKVLAETASTTPTRPLDLDEASQRLAGMQFHGSLWHRDVWTHARNSSMDLIITLRNHGDLMRMGDVQPRRESAAVERIRYVLSSRAAGNPGVLGFSLALIAYRCHEIDWQQRAANKVRELLFGRGYGAVYFIDSIFQAEAIASTHRPADDSLRALARDFSQAKVDEVAGGLAAWGRHHEIDAYESVLADAARLLRAAWAYGRSLAPTGAAGSSPLALRGVDSIKAELRAKRASGRDPGTLKSMLKLGQAFVEWWGRPEGERQRTISDIFRNVETMRTSPWGMAVHELLAWPAGLGVVTEHEEVCTALAEHDQHQCVYDYSASPGSADDGSATNTAAERLVRAAVKYGRALRHHEKHRMKDKRRARREGRDRLSDAELVRALATAFGEVPLDNDEACKRLRALRVAFEKWSGLSEQDRLSVCLHSQGDRHTEIHYAAHLALAVRVGDVAALASAAIVYARAGCKLLGGTIVRCTVDGPATVASSAREVLAAAGRFGGLYVLGEADSTAEEHDPIIGAFLCNFRRIIGLNRPEDDPALEQAIRALVRACEKWKPHAAENLRVHCVHDYMTGTRAAALLLLGIPADNFVRLAMAAVLFAEAVGRIESGNPWSCAPTVLLEDGTSSAEAADVLDAGYKLGRMFSAGAPA
jgi:hypothetical protein